MMNHLRIGLCSASLILFLTSCATPLPQPTKIQNNETTVPVPQKIDAALTEQCRVVPATLETNSDLLTLITNFADCNSDLNSRMQSIRSTQPQ